MMCKIMCKCADVQMCRLKKDLLFANILKYITNWFFICTSAHLHICTLTLFYVGF